MLGGDVVGLELDKNIKFMYTYIVIAACFFFRLIFFYCCNFFFWLMYASRRAGELHNMEIRFFFKGTTCSYGGVQLMRMLVMYRITNEV
jgi:hypothetical protein